MGDCLRRPGGCRATDIPTVTKTELSECILSDPLHWTRSTLGAGANNLDRVKLRVYADASLGAGDRVKWNSKMAK